MPCDPVFIAMDAPRYDVGTPAFVMHSPELVIATGLFIILVGPPPSRKRIAVGLSLSVIGFIAVAIMIGFAAN